MKDRIDITRFENNTSNDNSIDTFDTFDTFKKEKNNCKIFVGNVPYQCTQQEFENCFKNIEGFVKAEIITMHKTNLSRGFGFVTMQSSKDAKKLKMRNDIIFKGRLLRFTSYQNHNFKMTTDSANNYLFVNGIPDNKNRQWLRKCFANYEPIGKCFISMNHETGNMKNNGVIEIIDNDKYKAALNKKYHNVDNDIILETQKYRHKSYHAKVYTGARTSTHTRDYRFKKTNKDELYSAFIAGRNIGIIQGIKMAKISPPMLNINN